MATENPWRARRIQAELEKLGIRVSLATVSRYLPKKEPDLGQRQRWMTFLRNHRDAIGATSRRARLMAVEWLLIGAGLVLAFANGANDIDATLYRFRAQAPSGLEITRRVELAPAVSIGVPNK